VAGLSFEIVAVDAEQAELARAAFRRFGKGRHPAALNYGDVFAYALAKARGEPVLFSGNGFARTDIARAAP
jgi:ribonuclease VapC